MTFYMPKQTMQIERNIEEFIRELYPVTIHKIRTDHTGDTMVFIEITTEQYESKIAEALEYEFSAYLMDIDPSGYDAIDNDKVTSYDVFLYFDIENRFTS